MNHWIRATGLAVMAVLAALAAIPLLAWVLRVTVRNTVGNEAIVTTHDTLATVSIFALILVSLVRVIAVVGRTNRWSPLSRSIVAWDGMIATFFAWRLASEWVPWFRGPWERPVTLVALVVISVWGIMVIMRAAPPPLDGVRTGVRSKMRGPQRLPNGTTGDQSGDADDEAVTVIGG